MYCRRQEQDNGLFHERLCVKASHILLLILRKSLIVLIALPTPVIVYIIYSLLKPLNTVLTVSEEDNIITSCLILNSRSIKTDLLIDVCLSSEIFHTLYVLCYFYNVLCTLSQFRFIRVSLCNSARLTCSVETLLDLT